MDEGTREKTLQTAARVLQYRQRSARALYDRLLEKGCPEQEAAWAVARLQELGYLNDREYGRLLVRDLAARGYGAGRIRAVLREKKLDAAAAEEAMESYVPNQARLEAMAAARLKGQVPDRRLLKKTADSLFRKGFSWEEIRAALEAYSAALEESGRPDEG